MNTEYVLNTVKAILSTRKVGDPNYVHHQELISLVLEDLKMALSELVSENKLTFHKDINGRPLFYINGGVD